MEELLDILIFMVVGRSQIRVWLLLLITALCLLSLTCQNLELQTDNGLAALASQKWLDLQVFSLSGCVGITDKCVPFWCDLGRSLVGLNVMQCRSINGRSVDLLVEELRKCDIIYWWKFLFVCILLYKLFI